MILCNDCYLDKQEEFPNMTISQEESPVYNSMCEGCKKIGTCLFIRFSYGFKGIRTDSKKIKITHIEPKNTSN